MIRTISQTSSSQSTQFIAQLACLSLFTLSIIITLLYGPAGWISSAELLECLNQIGDCQHWTVITDIRLPRLVNAAMVGLSLAAAGVLSQGFFRNELASPSVTGAEAAGLLGAAIAYVFSDHNSQVWTLPVSAIIGVTIVSIFLAIMRSRMGAASTTIILLLGVAISALCSAFTSLIISWTARDPFLSGPLLNWLLGSLSSRGWQHAQIAAPLCGIGWIWAYKLSAQIDYLSFGSDFSQSVGISIKRVEFQLLLVVALLVGASIAIAGGIVFVGLLVPHLTRQMFGPHHRRLLVWSSLNGMSLVIVSDFIAKNISSQEINTGVIIALLGAPFFCLLLLRRMNSREKSGELT